ncbi:MAG: hypothetical protein ACRDD1_13255, partial [Planctomycetia bacterium]
PPSAVTARANKTTQKGCRMGMGAPRFLDRRTIDPNRCNKLNTGNRPSDRIASNYRLQIGTTRKA